LGETVEREKPKSFAVLDTLKPVCLDFHESMGFLNGVFQAWKSFGKS
jgi:hypothetical protein